MKEKIKIRCLFSMPTVEAIPLSSITGFEKYKFYIHKTLAPDLDYDWSRYTVTESTTGFAVANGKTRKEAINTAQVRLQKVGVREFDKMVKEIYDDYGTLD